MTRTRLSIAMLVLFAPAVALAGAGGGGNGGVGIGIGGHGVNVGIGMGSMNNIGHGAIGSATGISAGSVGTNAGGVTNASDAISSDGIGGAVSGSGGANASGRVAADTGPAADSDFGSLARAREDDIRAARERAAHTAARLAATRNAMESNAHGKAVAAEAHVAKIENDGDKVGEDVSAVARDKSTLRTHTSTDTRTRTTVAGTSADTDTRTSTSAMTHPVNHGAAVSAEAHMARSENDGDKVGTDVSAVARDKSTLKTRTMMHTRVASARTRTSTTTHPVNHGAAVSAEAHLAKSENDGDKVGTDVSAIAQDKSTLKARNK